MSNWKKIILLLVLIFVVDHVFAQGCSQCKLLAEQASGHGGREVSEDSFGRTLNYGILWLMAIPYILLTLFFGSLILIFMKARAKKKMVKKF
jgi:hypothetical protein